MESRLHYQGLAFERIGRAEDAHNCFVHAHQIDPDQFSLAPKWAELDWNALLEAALEQLPKALQGFYTGLPVRWSPFPAVEDLLENYPPLSPFTDGLYRGTRQPDADPWVSRPQYIMLFQGNLSRPMMVPEAVMGRIREALIHEALHWIGTSELPDE